MAPFGGATPAFDTSQWKTNFCKRAVDYAQIRSGGPPRDGIPPIDAPELVTVAAADAWLEDSEPVLALQLGDDVRAYPMQILIWHEIVNDTVGGRSVAVTFCPLCYAAIVFERPTVDGAVLSFGTTGNLRNSDLVMWDRQTESWWQQFTGQAIVGELTGRVLVQVPAHIVSWRDLKAAHPAATVLSRNTGHGRPYGRNPYVGYDDIGARPFAYSGEVGPELAPMAHVVGVEHRGVQRAYARATLRERGAINDALGATPVVVWWTSGTASALDADRIAAGRDIGAAGVFARRLGDRTLTFDRAGGGFRDRETGSTWNVLGRATGGQLAGAALEPLAHHNVFWFVWSAFAHAGTLYSESSLASP